MTTILYKKGDATSISDIKEITYIAHICNDIGAWGAGFVTAISKKWIEPKKQYKQLDKFVLGTNQYVNVEKNVIIVNMIAQRHIYSNKGIPPIRYEMLRVCLKELAQYILSKSELCTIQMPKIGAGLAGGDWKIIEKIIIEELCNKDIQVVVYTL